jgi:Bacteriophage tail sheath protein
MPEYLSPGVYVEEVDAGPKPIQGVSTSTAGAVGVTARGPTDGKPRLVTSFNEFVQTFGSFLPTPPAALVNRWALDPAQGGRWWLFPLSVQGFFENGGQRLYVKRVFSSGAAAANAVLGKGVVAHVVADTAANATQVRLEHVFGVDTTSAVTIFNGDNGQQIGGNFNVTAYDPAANRLTLGGPIPAPLLVSRGDFVQIQPRSASPVPNNEATLEFDAAARGVWGNALSVRTRPVAELTLNVLPDQAAGGAAASTTVANTQQAAGVWTITVASVNGFANNDHILVQGREYVISNMQAPQNQFDIAPGIPAGQVWGAGTVVKRLRAANAANAGSINVYGANQLYNGALLEFDNGTRKEITTVTSVAGDTVTLGAQLTQVYFENARARVLALQVDVAYTPDGTNVEASETFGPLRLVNDGSMSYVVTHINTRSQLVTVRTRAGFSDSNFTLFPTSASGGAVAFSNGDDDLNNLSPDDFIGVDGGANRRTGIQALEDIDEVSICMVPDVWASTVQSALITHCELLMDRFAILDPQDGLSNEGIRAFREPIDTKYAALYYPWLVVRDPLARKDVEVAPSGHMAGIYARTDVERGVHKAPANVVIRGIDTALPRRGLEQDVTKREQDMLNPKGINALRAFPNLGTRVWGARTLTSDMSWKYINVRRLFIYVEESIDEGTQWVVFEPNDERLWARVRQSISNFLTTVWRDGALEGTKAEEAFFVTCDRTTMTQDDLDNGRLIAVIGIAPVKPAEFVIFRIQQKTREAQPA